MLGVLLIANVYLCHSPSLLSDSSVYFDISCLLNFFLGHQQCHPDCDLGSVSSEINTDTFHLMSTEGNLGNLALGKVLCLRQKHRAG